MNVGVAVYNHSIAKLGAKPLEYRKGLPNFDPVRISETLWLAHGHQLFLDGLFNSDPHPGNVLITQTGELGLIDFGQGTEISLEVRVALARMLLALESGNE